MGGGGTIPPVLCGYVYAHTNPPFGTQTLQQPHLVWTGALSSLSSIVQTYSSFPWSVDDSGTFPCDGSPPPYPVVVNPPSPPPPPPPPPPPNGNGGGEPGGGGSGGGGPYIPPWPPSGNDPAGDELAQCCQATVQWLALIAYELQQWQQTNPGDGASSACCSAVVASITAVATSIQGVTAAINAAAGAGGGGTPVDLSGVIAALSQLVAAAVAWPPAYAAGIALLQTGLGNIATAIQSSQGTDVSGIIAALNKIFTTLDPPLGVYQQLQQDGFISSADLQLIGGGEFGSGLMVLFRKAGWNALLWLAQFVGFVWNGSTFVAQPASTTFSNDLAGLFNTMLGVGAGQLTQTVANIINQITPTLTGAGTPALGTYPASPLTAASAGLGVALGAQIAAWACSYLGIDIGQPLRRIADILGRAAGADELSDVMIGPLVRNGIGAVAEMNAARAFRQRLPGAGEVASYLARGLIDAPTAQFIAQLNGFVDTYIAVQQAGAYSGLNARMLIRLIETNIFSQADLTDELTFDGMRSVSQNRLLQAAPYLATATQRNSYIAALEAAYVAGLYSDSDFQSQVTNAQGIVDLPTLLLLTGQVKKLTAETKAIEAEYSTMFRAGLITDAQYRANLAALGLQPDMVNVVAGKAEAAANATLQKQTIREAAAAAKALTSATVKAAVSSFKQGAISQTALVAELIAAGQSAGQAAAVAELAALSFAGNQRWLYGLQLTQPASKLLSERVDALSTQLEHAQITDDQYVAALTALGIPPIYINVLHAKAAASKASAPLATLTPVSTS
jgi:hypothetical protein